METRTPPCHRQSAATTHSSNPLRFRCCSCGKTFSARFGQSNYASKLSIYTIHELQQELDKGLSVREVARKLKLSPSTVLRWKNSFEVHP